MTTLLLLFAVLAFAGDLAAQLPPVPVPPGNPMSADKVNLGKALFYDEQLSATRTVACGTCHAPDAGGGDPRSGFAVNPGPDGKYGTPDDIHGSPGVARNLPDGTYAPHAVFGFDVQVTGRAAPSAINAAYNREQFWDGRAAQQFVDPLTGAVVLPMGGSLESQAAAPPVGSAEMANEGRGWQDVADRVKVSAPLALAIDIPPALDTWIGRQTYPQLFQKVFGDNAVTPRRIVMAIAAYERTLISDQTPFDLGTMTAQQQLGLQIFGGKGRCTLCHAGNLFRDLNYHNTGFRPVTEDLGRYTVTNNTADRGAFKTPGLRNLVLRTSFMHNGGLRWITDVIDFYDRGGDYPENIDPAMKPLGLTIGEKVALLDFLQNGLLDPRVVNRTPPFDRPTLYSMAGRDPQPYGNGTPGTGGTVPRLISYEPAVLGNPHMTITLADGFGGAMAVLAVDTKQGFGFPVGGVPVLVGMSPAMVMVPLGALQGTGAGQGYWSGGFGIPNNAALSGLPLFMQGFVIDQGAAVGIAASSGLQMKLFDAR